jgi:hypothetical protein
MIVETIITQNIAVLGIVHLSYRELIVFSWKPHPSLCQETVA